MNAHFTRPLRLCSSIACVALAASLIPVPALAEDATTPQRFVNEGGSVDGNVTVDDGIYAVFAAGRTDEANANVEVTGNVTNSTENKDATFGAVAQGRDGGSGQIRVGGNVTVAPDNESNASTTVKGVLEDVSTGTAAATIGGNVYARGTKEAIGTEIHSFGNDASSATIEVGGDVSAVATQTTPGVSNRTYAADAQSNDQASALIKIAGNLVSTADGSDASAAMGINIYADKESSSVVEIQGNVQTTSSASAWGAGISTNGGTARLVVGGDVLAKGPDDGVGATLDSRHGGTPELVVKGIIHGSTAGIEFDGDKDASYDVTVWKIEVDDGGVLTKNAKGASEVPNDAASCIKYIIKLEQPQTGGTISALDATKAALAQSNGLDVAHAGDKVYLNVALESGYHISGAYNGLGDRVQLLHDEGGYYVVVPEGGGVYLTAELDHDAEVTATQATTQSQALAPAAPASTFTLPQKALPATGDTQPLAAPLMLALVGGACAISSRRLRA